jgi:hypothetical protein
MYGVSAAFAACFIDIIAGSAQPPMNKEAMHESSWGRDSRHAGGRAVQACGDVRENASTTSAHPG